MVEPRLISIAGIPAALEKATRYRLLNEPLEAESICRDVLAVDPENQEAVITLLLAVTDQLPPNGLEHLRPVLLAQRGLSCCASHAPCANLAVPLEKTGKALRKPRQK